MSLINIEYGSLASSEVLNKNFSHLEKKIDETFNSTMTSISSILSNIATINSRLSEQAEMVENNALEVSSMLDEYKNKTKIYMQKSCILPYWNGIRTIDISKNYSAETNGYLLLVPEENSVGNIKINNTTVNHKTTGIIVLPVKENDIVTTSIALQKAFFIPSTNIVFDNF